MKKYGYIFILLASIFFVGCGDDSENPPPTPTPPTEPILENSILADGENVYGYYGSWVMFGDKNISGHWTTTQEIVRGVDTKLEFKDDGILIIASGKTEYGVSNDGEVLESAIGTWSIIDNNVTEYCYEIEWDWGYKNGIAMMCKQN